MSSCSSIDLPVVRRKGASILTGPCVITSGLLDALAAVRAGALVAGGAVLGSAAEALCGIRQAQGSKAARVIARVRQPGPDGARGKCGTCEERTDDGTLCCWSAFVVDGMVLSLM